MHSSSFFLLPPLRLIITLIHLLLFVVKIVLIILKPLHQINYIDDENDLDDDMTGMMALSVWYLSKDESPQTNRKKSKNAS